MDWYLESLNSKLRKTLRDEVSRQAREVVSLLNPRMVRTASTDEINVHIDQGFAGKYRINLHLMDKNDAEAEKVKAEGHHGDSSAETVKTAADDKPEFRESSISFVSRDTANPNYLCSVVLQKPEDKVWCVSAYLMETYLGRYAYRANFYFRKDSKRVAHRCYERVSRAMRELRQDVIEDDILQNTVPRLVRKRLSSIEGEIEPRINKMSTYLNPDNTIEPADPEKQIATYIPTKRSVTDDLVMPEG